jgi:hypothetical protein
MYCSPLQRPPAAAVLPGGTPAVVPLADVLHTLAAADDICDVRIGRYIAISNEQAASGLREARVACHHQHCENKDCEHKLLIIKW